MFSLPRPACQPPLIQAPLGRPDSLLHAPEGAAAQLQNILSAENFCPPHSRAQIVAEGANMPSDPEAIKVYHDKGIEFGPAKVIP